MNDNQKTKLEGAPAPAERMLGWSLTGLAVSVVMFGGIVAWAATTLIDGAVIAPGMIVVESKRKAVQHLEGGIVADALVKDGHYVNAGDTLIRLDDTAARSELATIDDRLAAIVAEQARLRAELDDADHLTLPEELQARAGDPKIKLILDNEARLLASKRASQDASADLLTRRIRSLEAQIDGERKRMAASQNELDLVSDEAANLESLLKQKLVQSSRMLEVRRDMTRLASDIASNEAQIDSLGAQIREIQAQLRQTESTAQAQSATELAEAQSQIHALEEQRVVLRDRLARSVIVAPQSGRVINMSVNVAGAVIAPGETFMEIVPIDDNLVLEARVPPTDVERVQTGQQATVRLTAFNLNTTPELEGRVESVSADVLVPADGQPPYYSAKIVLAEASLPTDLGDELVPGMPVEVMVSTGERLASSYLLRPLVDSYARSFRDE